MKPDNAVAQRIIYTNVVVQDTRSPLADAVKAAVCQGWE
jgi:hypothetical protein